MPYELKTEIIIDADLNTVWNVLSDFNNYPQWNTFFKKITGELMVGEKLQVSIQPPNGKVMTFSPMLHVVTKGEEFRWRGVVGASWIFVGEHYFILERISPQSTKLLHDEKFGGLLLGLFKLMNLEKTKQGFENFNRELKQKCLE